MTDRSSRARLALKALDRRRILGDRRMKKLDRSKAAQHLIGRLVDRTHAAIAEKPNEVVAPRDDPSDELRIAADGTTGGGASKTAVGVACAAVRTFADHGPHLTILLHPIP